MSIACSPILAALFFFVASILRFVYYLNHTTRMHFNMENQLELDPDYIKREWEFREIQDPIVVSSNVLNVFGWVFFCIPMIQVAWVLSRGGVRKMRVHGGIVIFSIIGIVMELIARLLTFGSKTSAIWLAKTFNLDIWLTGDLNDNQSDGIGWRALEVNYRVIHGLITFVDSFEWVCLFIILCLVAHSVGSMNNRVLNIWWSRFGLLVAFLSLFELASAILLLFDRRDYTKFAVGIGVINMLIFMPMYLVILAVTLPKAIPNYQPSRAMG